MIEVFDAKRTRSYGCFASFKAHVFLLNSCLDLFSAPYLSVGTLYPEVTGSICLVP